MSTEHDKLTIEALEHQLANSEHILSADLRHRIAQVVAIAQRTVAVALPAATPVTVEVEEDPQEKWVTQDRVSARLNVDEFQWSDSSEKDKWFTVNSFVRSEYGDQAKHGWLDPKDGLMFRLRCKKKDYPTGPVRIAVTQWVSPRLLAEGGDWPVRCTKAGQPGPRGWHEVKIDETIGLYVDMPVPEGTCG